MLMLAHRPRPNSADQYYKPLKNLSSTARRAVSRAVQAAVIGPAIVPIFV
jgi:hypothetical protein